MLDFVFVGRFGVVAAACGLAALMALPAAAAEKPAAGAASGDSGDVAPVVKPTPKPAAKPAAAPAPAAGAPAADAGTSPWVKLCDTDPNLKKELCVISQELRTSSGQFVASATIRTITSEDKISFVAVVPLGMQLPSGMRVQIDSGKQYPIPYELCFANGCYGHIDVDEDFVKALRNGKQLTVLALSPRAKGAASFPMSLAGFSKSYDSKGLDAQAAQQRQQDLNKALQARAEEARKKLIEQQQKESGGAAPAQ